MARFVALYRIPADAADAERFEAQYRESHLPLVAATPGLVDVELSRVGRTLTGPSPLLLMAVMTFRDKAAMSEGMRSPEWAESGRNLAEIGGLELATMFTLDDPEGLDLRT